MCHSAFTGRPTAQAGEAILSFWFEESKPYQWFRRDKNFDRTIASRFGPLLTAAGNGKLNAWRTHPRFSLSLIILLDQFSRNIYRDDPRAFEKDYLARDVANDAIARWFDRVAPPKRRSFYYMPFMHGETLADQKRSVELFKSRMPASGNLSFAIEHHDIVERFGRFPHRNKVMGRKSTAEEIAFLKAGGFNP